MAALLVCLTMGLGATLRAARAISVAALAIIFPIGVHVWVISVGGDLGLSDRAGALVAGVGLLWTAWVIIAPNRVPASQFGLLALAAALIAVGSALPDLYGLLIGLPSDRLLVARLMVDLSAPFLALVIVWRRSDTQVQQLILQTGITFLLASLVAVVLLPEVAIHSPSGRFQGVFPLPNLLGFVALVTGVSVLSKSRWSLSSVLGIVLCVAMAIWSGQRSAWVPLILIVSWSVLIRLGSKFGRGNGVVLAFTTLVLSLGGLLAFLADVASSRVLSNESRFALWKFLITDRDVWWPSGLGTRGLWDLDLLSAGLPERYFHAHNQLLSWLVAGGALAAVGCLLLLGAVVRSFLRGDRVAMLAALTISFAVESPLNTGGRGLLLPVALFGYLALWSAIGQSPSGMTTGSDRRGHESRV